MVDIRPLLVTPETSIHRAMECIDRNTKGIALVVDSRGRLLATVTDGDIRRAILAGVNLDLPVRTLLDRPLREPYRTPFTALVGTDESELLRLMNHHGLRHIPLVDSDGRVVDVALLNDLVKEYELPLTAVIMAGGYGSRLRPLTDDTPKPMLPIGDRPLMERTIQQLREAGIRRVNVTTHYLSEQITRHFGNGSAFGVDLNYVSEDRPLGTAGALGMMQAPTEPLLVINGDVLTGVNFRNILAYHREQRADLTVAVRRHDVSVPYGVVECDGARVRIVREKPVYRFLVNAGIYLLDPSVHSYIPVGERFDMVELIQRLIDEDKTVVNFPVVEYWRDIGRQADYELAQEDVKNGRLNH